MTAYTLPQAVAAYPLPNGGFASSPEEYAAKVVEAEARARAEAFVTANSDTFAKGQATRAKSTITAFLQFEAGQAFAAQQAAAAQAA